MTSPFSGMDPYLEACGLWADFHDELIAEIKRGLQASLPERYFVQTGERSYVVLAGIDQKKTKSFLPDVRVESREAPGRPRGTALAEPAVRGVTMHAFIDERFRENFIEVIEADGENHLVTSLEVLSPSNKRRDTEGWDVYLRKRNALMLGAANFVEIDLLRGGDRMPMVETWPDSPYYVLVSWRADAPACRVFSAHFRRPLPDLLVPLADPDPDVRLPLQAMIDAIFARCRYARRIDYARPLTPPLDPDPAAPKARKGRRR